MSAPRDYDLSAGFADEEKAALAPMFRFYRSKISSLLSENQLLRAQNETLLSQNESLRRRVPDLQALYDAALKKLRVLEQKRKEESSTKSMPSVIVALPEETKPLCEVVLQVADPKSVVPSSSPVATEPSVVPLSDEADDDFPDGDDGKHASKPGEPGSDGASVVSEATSATSEAGETRQSGDAHIPVVFPGSSPAEQSQKSGAMAAIGERVGGGGNFMYMEGGSVQGPTSMEQILKWIKLGTYNDSLLVKPVSVSASVPETAESVSDGGADAADSKDVTGFVELKSLLPPGFSLPERRAETVDDEPRAIRCRLFSTDDGNLIRCSLIDVTLPAPLSRLTLPPRPEVRADDEDEDEGEGEVAAAAAAAAAVAVVGAAEKTVESKVNSGWRQRARKAGERRFSPRASSGSSGFSGPVAKRTPPKESETNILRVVLIEGAHEEKVSRDEMFDYWSRVLKKAFGGGLSMVFKSRKGIVPYFRRLKTAIAALRIGKLTIGDRYYPVRSLQPELKDAVFLTGIFPGSVRGQMERFFGRKRISSLQFHQKSYRKAFLHLRPQSAVQEAFLRVKDFLNVLPPSGTFEPMIKGHRYMSYFTLVVSGLDLRSVRISELTRGFCRKFVFIRGPHNSSEGTVMLHFLTKYCAKTFINTYNDKVVLGQKLKVSRYGEEPSKKSEGGVS